MSKELLDRYLKTIKGRQIIAASMISPIRLCRPIYKDGTVYHKIDGKLLNPEEVEIWKSEQQKIYRKQAMEQFGLIEEDFQLSEEKLKQIEHDEGIGRIRNVVLVGSEDAEHDDLREAMLKNSAELKLRPLGLG